MLGRDQTLYDHFFTLKKCAQNQFKAFLQVITAFQLHQNQKEMIIELYEFFIREI